MPFFWAYHDLDDPYTGAPLALTTPGLAERFDPVGGWQVDFRGTITLSIHNDSATAKTLRAAIRGSGWSWESTAEHEIPIDSTVDFELSAAAMTSDLVTVTVDYDCTSCLVTAITFGSGESEELVVAFAMDGYLAELDSNAYIFIDASMETEKSTIDITATNPPVGRGRMYAPAGTLHGHGINAGKMEAKAATMSATAYNPVKVVGALIAPISSLSCTGLNVGAATCSMHASLATIAAIQSAFADTLTVDGAMDAPCADISAMSDTRVFVTCSLEPRLAQIRSIIPPDFSTIILQYHQPQ
jgi:hypothetical protein